MTSGTVIVKSVDMRDEMRQEAISCAMQALEAHDIEKDIAAFIKKHFDGRYEPTWHCIVGQSFGSFVTHESGYFIYLYVGWFLTSIRATIQANKQFFSSRLGDVGMFFSQVLQSMSLQSVNVPVLLNKMWKVQGLTYNPGHSGLRRGEVAEVAFSPLRSRQTG